MLGFTYRVKSTACVEGSVPNSCVGSRSRIERYAFGRYQYLIDRSVFPLDIRENSPQSSVLWSHASETLDSTWRDRIGGCNLCWSCSGIGQSSFGRIETGQSLLGAGVVVVGRLGLWKGLHLERNRCELHP